MTDELATTLQGVTLEVPDVPSTASSSSSRKPAKTATELVQSLQQATESGSRSKRLIHSTTHYVEKQPGVAAGPSETPSQAKFALVSWKTAEFAYRKSAGLSSELPTLARGLFTEQVGEQEHRIVVRGYDKFFNVGELPWTKPEAIARFSTPPYHLTFKENGCIIFISALSSDELVVTSKHSLGARADAEMSHAVKGEEWLRRHLKQRGRTETELAAELWRRNETAVCELCDDSFEEHVIAYAAENSGLHLHGLNANQPKFQTRPMAEVDTFAREWGFIPTRWLELNSMAEVDKLTAEVSRTGSWKGEAIEGFVVRTHMQSKADGNAATCGTAVELQTARPPYEPGQEWFYKIKFDEPYLMYRDWRELTRRLLKEKKDWERDTKDINIETNAVHQISAEEGTAEQPSATTASTSAPSQPADPGDEPQKSKKQLKKEKNAAQTAQRKAEAIAAKAIQPTASASARPPRPVLRFKRPKTVLYVEWAYDRLHGTQDGKIKAQPEMFEAFNYGKGIIALREAYLAYLQTPEGSKRLKQLGGAVADDTPGNADSAKDDKLQKTLIVPVGVPGCGKTSLFVALHAIFGWAHTQSDNVQTKKTGPQFLANIERELVRHDVVIADRNNHLFKHRDEIVGVVERVQRNGVHVSKPGDTPSASDSEHKQKKDKNAAKKTAAPAKVKPRIQLVAITWAFDSHALNEVHEVCSRRIIRRGENHQSLRVEGKHATADASASKRTKLPHDAVLWNFLEQLQPFGSSLGGEGDEGQADELFNHTIKLEIDLDQERTLRTVISSLVPLLKMTQPSEEQIRRGLEAAQAYKVDIRKDMNLKNATPKPRYYGLRVDTSLDKLVEQLIASCPDFSLQDQARKAFHQLRDKNRIIACPHITLVHNKSVEAEETAKKSAKDKQGPPDGDAAGAKKRWETYQKLCQQHGSFENQEREEGDDKEHPLDFTFVVDKLVWNDRVMTLSVRNVATAHLPDFVQLQGGAGGPSQGYWRPHITIGTARDEIRPVEAREAILLAEEGKGEVHMIDAGSRGISSAGRLQGMWS